MPAPSWFQKLRRRKKTTKKQGPCNGHGAEDGAARTSPSSAKNNSQCQALLSAPAAACAVSSNRASYYLASVDRARQDGLHRVVVGRRDDAEAAALDVRVDVVHRRAGDRRRLGGLDAPPGTPKLKLRPIVTGRDVDVSDDGVSSAATSAATTPSTRARGFHVKSAACRSHRRQRRRRYDHDCGMRKDHPIKNADEAATSPSRYGGARRRLWLYESLVVVKESSDPERELAESMAEMVVANGIQSCEDLEELLACYLALNATEHHRAVVAAFRCVWLHLARPRAQSRRRLGIPPQTLISQY